MHNPISEGTILNNRYLVKRMIDKGGMSIIYEVEDSRLSGRWALKELDIASNNEEEQKIIQGQFRKEAELLSKLSHNNLVKVVDYFIENDREFLVEEFINGKTLLKLTEEQYEFSESQVKEIAMEICDCLTYIHNKGIIYRDLKPSNIIMNEEGQIKLLDFGIARLYSEDKTQDTIIMGTPGYSPPEQYGKSQTDARSDIFSLGALMHFLLSKKDPGENPFVFLPLTTTNKNISMRIENIINRATKTNPDDRFHSAQEMKEAILKAAGHCVDEQVFSYSIPHLTWYQCLISSTVIAAFDLVLITVNPIWTIDIVLLGILPFISTVPAILYHEIKKRMNVRIIVNEEGLQFYNKSCRIKASWNEVESLVFISKMEKMMVSVVSEVEVRTKNGKFNYDTSPKPKAGIQMSITNHNLLTEIIINNAGLKQKAPGSNIYIKSL